MTVSPEDNPVVPIIARLHADHCPTSKEIQTLLDHRDEAVALLLPILQQDGNGARCSTSSCARGLLAQPGNLVDASFADEEERREALRLQAPRETGHPEQTQ